MKKFNLSTFFVSILLLALGLTACDRSIDTRPIPEDTDPGISLEVPARANFTRRLFESVDLTFRLTDNESLKVFRVVEALYDTAGNPLVENFVRETETITGEVLLKDYTYSVPPTMGANLVEPYFTIELTFYVIDTKGAADETKVRIDVLPPMDDPEPFLVREYLDNVMDHPNAFNGNNDFDFYNPGVSPNIDLDKDILIVDQLPGSLADKRLMSPNNELRGTDSVFVLTDPTRINYDSVTYTILREAWYAGNPIANEVDIPEVGTYVIVRLAKGTQEQFAIFKPTEYGRANGLEFIRFDYKVTN